MRSLVTQRGLVTVQIFVAVPLRYLQLQALPAEGRVLCASHGSGQCRLPGVWCP